MSFKKCLKKIRDIVIIRYKNKIDYMSIKKSEENTKFLDINILNMVNIGLL